MRSILTFAILTVLLNSTLAQPEISKEWAPDIGDNWSIFVLAEVPEHGEGGADVTWDFTALNANAIKFNLVYDWIDPNVTPYVDSFPESTIAAQLGFGGISSFGYYAETEDAFEYHGSGSQFGLDIYLDPQTLKYVDLSYGEAVVDTYETVSLNNFSQPDTLTGYTTYMYDGYGTVKVGDFVLDDAIRVYQEDCVYDSTANYSFTDVFIDSTTTYAWIAEGTIFPVVQWQRTTTVRRTYIGEELVNEEREGPDTIFAYDPSYGETSGFGKVVTLPTLQIYPTSTSDFINVKRSALKETNYNIYAIGGKFISAGKLTSRTDRIHVSTLPSGWYVLQVDGYRPERFMKQK